mmetsp:Transcript_7109/g.14798  ORF Transcript_7109/g.14798 Transcript_7109/m.14798 type:complete len:261 (+) Transcript_7109:239-1021(+)
MPGPLSGFVQRAHVRASAETTPLARGCRNLSGRAWRREDSALPSRRPAPSPVEATPHQPPAPPLLPPSWQRHCHHLGPPPAAARAHGRAAGPHSHRPVKCPLPAVAQSSRAHPSAHVHARPSAPGPQRGRRRWPQNRTAGPRRALQTAPAPSRWKATTTPSGPPPRPRLQQNLHHPQRSRCSQLPQEAGAPRSRPRAASAAPARAGAAQTPRDSLPCQGQPPHLGALWRRTSRRSRRAQRHLQSSGRQPRPRLRGEGVRP